MVGEAQILGCRRNVDQAVVSTWLIMQNKANFRVA
jgi:hypothetical protein